MELQTIQTQTTWNDAAERINRNNAKIDLEVEKLKNATYKHKGYFKSASALVKAFPLASVGCIAYVGSSYPYAIYIWSKAANTWINSGETGGDEFWSADKFYTKEETENMLAKLSDEVGARARVKDYYGVNYAEVEGIATNDFYYSMPDAANGNEDDIIATNNYLKTINGQSILGKGNIIIEGGEYSHNIGSMELFDQIIAERRNHNLTQEDKDAILNGKIITTSVGNGVVPTISSNSMGENGAVLIFHFNERLYEMFVMWTDTLCYINGVLSFTRETKLYADSELSETSENSVQNKVVTEKLAELSAEVNEVTEKIDNINPAPMISVTYAELVALRDNGELVAGMQYRITDFVTTTAQENTRSVGHQFDVIVTADNENTLNEVARACRSEFDIEKYKDAYSVSSEVKMLYVGLFSHDGKECHLYESEDHFFQMLMDFNVVINLSYFDTSAEYPYSIFPLYTRWNNEGQWGEWFNGKGEGETICFKHNPAEATYFNSSNLAAWQLWYCLDNDVERFAWASNKEAISNGDSIFYRNPSLDTTNNDVLYYAWRNEYEEVMVYTINENPTEGEIIYDDTFAEDWEITKVITKGKGVIYRMIDEWENDCPYDFKNIQFKRFAVAEYDKVPSLVVDNEENYYGYYYGALNLYGEQAIQEAIYGEDFIWAYTFALKDLATETWHDYTILNSIGLKTDESVIITCHSNVIKEHRDEYLGEHGRKAIWLNNIVFFNCYADISSPDYSDDYSYCNSNSFGNECNSNSFGNYCYSNSFGNYCNYNSFGDSCNSNSFGNYCYYNSFGNCCSSNSFGNDCSSNNFGNYCNSNSFGNECYSNSFGNECNSNSFGNDCSSNSFGNSSQSNKLKAYYRYITFEEGVQYVTLLNETEGDYENQVQNYRVANGTHGEDGNPLIVDVTRNMGCETFIGMDSNDELKVFCLADLLNL